MSLFVLFKNGNEFQARTMSEVPRKNEIVNFKQEFSDNAIRKRLVVDYLEWFPDQVATYTFSKYHHHFDVIVHLRTLKD